MTARGQRRRSTVDRGSSNTGIPYAKCPDGRVFISDAEARGAMGAYASDLGTAHD